ncbi:MAG: diaminopimelate epimerase [Verrucomicrobia bacterium]|nr:diaminopimelate epimerase [Verrucomicrobiota bacterium]
MKFAKYHALGNDYLVLDPSVVSPDLNPEKIKRICHRNFGAGSDGILLGPLPSKLCQFGLRIFNPDGSEAEKSGNGLRIFARYLWDSGLVKDDEFSVETLGGAVKATVFDGGGTVRVEMGRVLFSSSKIPVEGPDREVINELLHVGGRDFTFCAATVGNPHCVIPVSVLEADLAKQFGPSIERHALFPNRTNVQFMKVLDRNNIQIEIWERGAGYTLASGSSSSACAAVARRLDLCDSKITVHMPGGRIEIELDDDYSVLMTGPVTKVAEGMMSKEIFEATVPL